MGTQVTRCPVCNQTVVADSGVINVHNRVLGGKNVQCAGSGQRG